MYPGLTKTKNIKKNNYPRAKTPGKQKKETKMFANIKLLRIKGMMFFRQFYMPGMRAAFLVFVVNLIIMLIIKFVTMRMAHEAMIHKQFIAKPVHRRYAHAHAGSK